MQAIKVERQIAGRTLAIETGTLAKLAGGAVTVRFGDTIVMAAVVRANPARGDRLSSRCRSTTVNAGPRRASSPVDF